ncbi:Conserved_hypothetical protein [Hexamita inflata]|uniref:Uncharacterized protein n=1 Tax=Hexamita inflata TaxID=28002 RepID=A0ABP1K2P6_9EUKA
MDFGKALYNNQKVGTISSQPGSQQVFTNRENEIVQKLIQAILTAENTQQDLLFQNLKTFSIICQKRLNTIQSNIDKLQLKIADGIPDLTDVLDKFQQERNAIICAFQNITKTLLNSKIERVLFQYLHILNEISFISVSNLDVIDIANENIKLAMDYFNKLKITFKQDDTMYTQIQHEYELAQDFKQIQEATIKQFIYSYNSQNWELLLSDLISEATMFSSEQYISDNFKSLMSRVIFVQTFNQKIQSPNLLQAIMNLYKFIIQHQTVYINIVDDAENDNEGDYDSYNQLIWLFEMLFVQQYMRNCISVASLSDFLYQFGFKSIHVHCNNIIQQELIKIIPLLNEVELMLLLKSIITDFGGDKIVSQRRAGVLPQLFSAVFTFKQFQGLTADLMLSSDNDKETVQKFQIIRLLVLEGRITGMQNFHAILLQLLQKVGNNSYMVRNSCFLLFGGLIQQIALYNQKRNYSIVSLEDAVRLELLSALKSDSHYRVLLAAEFISYLHVKFIEQMDETSQNIYIQILALLNTYDSFQITPKQIFYSSTPISNPYIQQVLVRCLMCFIGTGSTGLTHSLALNLNNQNLKTLLRMQIREFEFFKVGRGHSTFSEQKINYRLKPAFSDELKKKVVEIGEELLEEMNEILKVGENVKE